MSRAPSNTDALVDFVLRHGQVRPRVSSWQHGSSGYTLIPRKIDDYNIIYVTRGRCVWVIEDESYDLPTGRLILVPPGVEHHAYSRTKRFALVSLHGEISLPSGDDALAMLRPRPSRDVPPASPLDRYLRGAEAEFSRTLADRQRVMGWWTRLSFNELIRSDHAARLLDPIPIDPLIHTVITRITERIAEPVRLDDLAAWSGYSAQHLNRLFSRVLGVTPLQYLAKLRMERAAELLEDQRLTVAAVGERVGFADPYYFSRAFRKHSGLSPTAYRSALGSDFPA